MQGKLCLVTGATDGIGRATALQLAALGAEVVIVGRDRAKTEATLESLRSVSASPLVEGLVADLSRLADVRALARRFLARHARLDVLVNNVGAGFRERRESAEGIEMTWALNHLGPFLLTDLLLDALRAAPAGRVVQVSSNAHRRGRMPFDDLEGRERYHYWRAYRQSKLANVLFTYELARRLEGTPVTANALHPGIVSTAFFRGALIRTAKRALVGIVSMTPEKGARTSVYAASAPELAHVSGAYFERQRAVRSAPLTYDRGVARRLWEVSAERCGLA